MRPERDRAVTRLLVRNLVWDAATRVRGRTARVALTALGTVLGVASLVAVLGLADTARVQISDRFDVLRATEVTVTDRRPSEPDPPFPDDVRAAIAQLVGIEAGGLVWSVDNAANVQPSDGLRRTVLLPVMAADPGGLEVMRPTMGSGRLYDQGADARGDHVVVLGAVAATRLGFGDADGTAAVRIGGVAFTVVGTIDDVERRPQTLAAVIVPAGTARQLWGEPQGDEADPAVLLDTRPGAAQVAGAQVAVALRPHGPDRLVVAVPPDPATLRQQVDTDLGNLLVLLAGVCLVIGAVGIGNATFVSVVERTAELGLRRALGARPRHLAALIALEAGIVGGAGGIVGAWLGVITVVGVSVAHGWQPVLSPLVLLAAPLIGSLTGVVAGLAPARRAANIEPVDALRR